MVFLTATELFMNFCTIASVLDPFFFFFFLNEFCRFDYIPRDKDEFDQRENFTGGFKKKGRKKKG